VENIRQPEQMIELAEFEAVGLSDFDDSTDSAEAVKH